MLGTHGREVYILASAQSPTGLLMGQPTHNSNSQASKHTHPNLENIAKGSFSGLDS